MKGRARYIIPAVLLLLFGLVAWRIMGNSSSSDTRRQNTPLVRVDQPRRETVITTLRFTGDILPIQQANIYSKVNGTLNRVYVDIGASVRQGQLLALIDTTELSQQVQQNAAKFQNARLNYERTKELAEQNLVAKQDLDNADAAMKVARADYEAAKTRLSYARITAPFAGYITKRFLDEGANVTSNNATLFTLMDIDQLKIMVSVLEKDISLVRLGESATIRVDAFPGNVFLGKVARFSQSVDLSTRTMAVEIDVPNQKPGIRLTPGMFANITLIVREDKDAITVPTDALLKDDRSYYVYVIDSTVAHRKDITVGVEQNGRTEVSSGLTGTERLVVAGQQLIRDGGQVMMQQ
ncbi:MAG: efflux RND transporter periplasmic adaptor subunit [Ignavibacteriae bacterium]|nr:efflux RND transporter periplasmic adaptor subunit [Ignavibacteria bacterium]MBI3365171.1 efflux RND transporter periplasmic adaptor subunit [Ignavibacteriota bacterium]